MRKLLCSFDIYSLLQVCFGRNAFQDVNFWNICLNKKSVKVFWPDSYCIYRSAQQCNLTVHIHKQDFMLTSKLSHFITNYQIIITSIIPQIHFIIYVHFLTTTVQSLAILQRRTLGRSPES